VRTHPPAIAGTFSPNNPLSAFDGESIAGTWTLTISDRASGDEGTLNAWCLLPTTLVCTAGTPGRPNCHDQCISALAHDHGGIARAASDLGFSSVANLQAAVTDFCGN
jgi:subtilisin-like proprotein convertase family protein